MKPEANLLQSMKQPEEEEKDKLAQKKPDIIYRQQDKQPEEEEEDKKIAQMQPMVQRRSGEGEANATADVESSIKYARGKGRPLPEQIRGSMEQAFGADFSGVRVHTDTNADRLNRSIQARAFTTGQNVFFRRGELALGSKRGQELLAHELTHVVQQNGSAVQPKANQAADAKTWMPDPPYQKGMMDSQPSENTGIQRLCSKCEKEHKQLKKEDETKGTIQAKALSSPSSGVGIQSPVPNAHVEPSASQKSAAELVGGRAVPEGIDSNGSLNRNAGKLSPFNAEEADRPPDTPQARTQAIENVLAVKENAAELNDPGFAQSVEIASPPEPPPVVEVGSKPTEDETSPIPKAVESASIPQEKLNLPKEATAEADKEPTQSEALEKVPEVKALGEVLADKQADNLLPEGKGEAGEAASPKTAAEKEQSTKDASEAQAQLDEKHAEATQSASTGINFVLPKNAITIEGEGVPAFLRRRREIASRMADQFLAAATSRVQTVTQLGQEISAPIQTAAENAKASITSTVEQQRAEVAAQIAQQREQAQSAAQETQAEIQNQYQTAVTTVSQTTADNRQQVETENTNALQTLDEREKEQLDNVDKLYARTDKQYRDTGVKIGDEAIAIGEEMARQWESQVKGRDDNFWDGPLTDNRLKAKANAAREVAKQYKPGLIDAANNNAEEVQKGKEKDIEGIQKIANESREALETQKTNALDALNSTEQQARSQAQAAQTNFTETANQSLQATLQSLNQEEVTQLQLLAAYGQRQVLAIDRDAQKAIASLQEGVNQVVSNLQDMLHNIEAEMQGKETPDLNTFSSVLAEQLDQLDEAVATAQAQTRQGITASEQGINQGGQKAIAGIAPIAQNGIEQARATGEGLKTTLADLKQGATTTFNEIQQTHTTTITNITNTALEGFQQVTQGIQTTFEQITKNLDSGLQESVKKLEKGLRDTFGEMRAKIEEEANKAADQVQPRWKGILKIVVAIAVVVAVAVVAGPAVIGAVGAAAGALGASAAAASAIGAVVGGAIVGAAAGAVVQMGNNLIDGKNLFDGVGEAMLVGAIGGALGGAGGALGNFLAAGKGLAQTALRFGIDTAFDIGGGTLGDLAVGNPITLEGVLIGAAIGAGVSVAVAGVVKVKSAVSGKVDVSTGSRPNTELPTVNRPELEVNDSAIGVKSSQTRGRSTHFDEPEIKNKPGVVAEQKASDGHEYKVLSDGRLVRCTSCTVVPQPAQGTPSQSGEGRNIRQSTRKRKRTWESMGGSTDPRTRAGKKNREAIEKGGGIVTRNLSRQPYKKADDGQRLFDGSKRPQWGKDFEDNFWKDVRKITANGRVEYECITGQRQKQYLPRKKDAKKGEDTASIGHKTQWRDFISKTVDIKRFSVDNGKKEIWAYSMDDVEKAYKNSSNLQPEGQIFNSKQSGKPYKGDPLTQTYVKPEGNI